MRLALIVASEAAGAEPIAAILKRRGTRPVVGRDGESALLLARMLRPDVVLVDEHLPDADGFEVCRRLRADDRTMATPIVMVVDLDNSTNRRRGFRVGANAHLARPVEAPALDAALVAAEEWREGLRRARLRGEVELELDSVADTLVDVNDFLAELCGHTPLTPDQINHIRQAFMEMGLNAIEWGNRRRAEKIVSIVYRAYPDRVEIVVRDQGPGFNPAELPHAASADDPIAHLEVREQLGLREGGFGLMIARGMLDELRYNHRGNEVTLIKRFPAGDAGRPESPNPADSGAVGVPPTR